MRRLVFFLLIVLLFIPSIARAQVSQNGHGGRFEDKFLDGLVGEYIVKRSIRGKVFESRMTTSWVLNHQFFSLWMSDGKDPSDYSAQVFIGYDDAKKSYVVHWIDTFGGSISETVGYGKRDGYKIVFEFAYPDGPFRNTLSWEPKTDTWKFTMQNSDGKSGWKLFAEDVLTRRNR